MRKLSPKGTKVISLRLPIEYVEVFQKMSDKANPWRAVMRYALKWYLEKMGRL